MPAVYRGSNPKGSSVPLAPALTVARLSGCLAIVRGTELGRAADGRVSEVVADDLSYRADRLFGFVAGAVERLLHVMNLPRSMLVPDHARTTRLAGFSCFAALCLKQRITSARGDLGGNGANWPLGLFTPKAFQRPATPRG